MMEIFRGYREIINPLFAVFIVALFIFSTPSHAFYLPGVAPQDFLKLCSEDYQWWWRSYLTSGSSALYLFLYAIFYFFTKLEISKPVSGILYFGYMFIASLAFFVLTGAIGFCSCFWFTRLIYSSVKID